LPLSGMITSVPWRPCRTSVAGAMVRPSGCGAPGARECGQTEPKTWAASPSL